MKRSMGQNALRAVVCAALTAASLAGHAQVPATDANSADSAARINPLTRKLLDALIAKEILTAEQAAQLVREAQAEQAAAQSAPAAPAHTVPYVPEEVRQKIRDELRKEVMAQAKAEGWAAPNMSPEWARRIELIGDVRVRGEAVEQDDGNDPFSLNFNAINSGSGFDLRLFENPPFVNTTRNRQRARIRARVGLVAKPDDWISAGVRIASGSDRSPVSTNQTLGADGELSKYALWLDRAYVRLTPFEDFSIDFGRGENPFWTSDILFDDDLNFDGASLSYRPTPKGFTVFGTAGAFPVYNTAFNVGNTDVEKTKSRDKYLYAGQLGLGFTADSGTGVKLAVGYFRFDNSEGEVSSECTTLNSSDSCDTDISRPQFVQQGNTMFGIRNIVLPPGTTDPNSVAQRQYFGLATPFEVAAAHVAFDIHSFKPVRIRIEGDYARNLAFDEEDILARTPINNYSADNPVTPIDESKWESGDTAWMAKIVVGHPQIDRQGAWSVSIAYKHIEADSVPDAFNDSDFHLGGTNSEGFVVAADIGIGRQTGVGIRWYGANEIDGSPFSNDVYHLDLVTKF